MKDITKLTMEERQKLYNNNAFVRGMVLKEPLGSLESVIEERHGVAMWEYEEKQMILAYVFASDEKNQKYFFVDGGDAGMTIDAIVDYAGGNVFLVDDEYILHMPDGIEKQAEPDFMNWDE